MIVKIIVRINNIIFNDDFWGCGGITGAGVMFGWLLVWIGVGLGVIFG